MGNDENYKTKKLGRFGRGLRIGAKDLRRGMMKTAI